MKKIVKKLALNKQTMALLDEKEIANLQGGKRRNNNSQVTGGCEWTEGNNGGCMATDFLCVPTDTNYTVGFCN